MQDLIARLTKTTGLSDKKAEEALGIVLSLIRTQGNQKKVEALFSKLPGAEDLVSRHGGTGGGGLLGKLGGGLMGGPLVAISKQCKTNTLASAWEIGHARRVRLSTRPVCYVRGLAKRQSAH